LTFLGLIYQTKECSSGGLIGNRIQSNDYFEVIGITGYRSQKVIVTKYPDPYAGQRLQIIREYLAELLVSRHRYRSVET